jgi:hypothetical protein
MIMHQYPTLSYLLSDIIVSTRKQLFNLFFWNRHRASQMTNQCPTPMYFFLNINNNGFAELSACLRQRLRWDHLTINDFPESLHACPFS